MDSPTKHNVDKWSIYGARIFFSTISHPFEYAKVLIQIGYEPFPPQPAKTLLGRSALKLPSVFQYIKHIYSVDGFVGCYRGLSPKICGSLLSAIITQRVIDHLGLQPSYSTDVDVDDDPNSEDNGNEHANDAQRKKTLFYQSLKTDLITHSVALIIVNSFHVITVRMMAEFVGHESIYSGILSSIRAIYTVNGIGGFFAGFVPRWLGDILSVLLANTLTFGVNTYLPLDKEIQEYTAAAMSLLSSSIMYPFQVVSNCMTVADSGLIAGRPPYMPHYDNWLDCWSNLSQTGQLKRGSSLIFRYYIPPQNSLDAAFLYKSKYST